MISTGFSYVMQKVFLQIRSDMCAFWLIFYILRIDIFKNQFSFPYICNL